MEEIIAYIADKILSVSQQSLDYVVISGGRSDDGFIVILFYCEKKPAVIAKVARIDPRRLKQEYNNITNVTGLLKNTKLKTTVENPYGLINLSGREILFKEFKDGVSGEGYISRWSLQRRSRRLKFLHLSTGWLIDFITATREYHINSYTAKEATIQSLTGLEAPHYSESLCADGRIFACPSHGDFVTSNVLVSKIGVNIIDFENFTLLSFPVIDLISIIVDTGTTIFGYNEDMIIKTFFQPNWFSLAVKDNVLTFCEDINIELNVLTSMLPLYSDRALYLCQTWGMNELLPFHQKLKSYFEENKSEILWRD